MIDDFTGKAKAMRKGSDVIGKPIVAYDTGESFSRVKDLIFNQDDNQLLAFLIGEGGLFGGAKVLPFEAVQAIGSDAIIALSEDAVVRAKNFPAAKQILDRNNILKGTHILTMDGRNLGRMLDLYFDEDSGTIEGYEVSGGLFADAYSGRSFVPAPKTLKIGEHVAFVPSEVAELMEEQLGGIRGVIQDANDRVSAAAQSTNERLQSATEEAGYRFQDAKCQAAASLTDAVVDPAEQKEFVIGKVAKEDVTAPDGTLLAFKEQIITLSDAQDAEDQGVLDVLYRAAGGDIGQRTSNTLQTAVQAASQRLRATADQTSRKMQETGRDAAIALTNAVIDPVEQKAFAMGKPVQWTIATPEGTLLALAGQEVTTAIVNSAEQQGVLSELYRATGGSVSNELTRKAGVAVDGTVARHLVDQTEGRRVQQMIRTREGLIVAAPGQIVTESVIERAKTYHKESELLNAVGLSTREAARHRVNDTANTTGDRFGTTAQGFGEQFYQGTEQVKAGALTLWGQLRVSANDLQERSTRALQEQRVKHALGRPVTRVILDQNDNVILNLGELITHHAIESARQANVLDILLGATSSQAPQFSKSESSAAEPGKDSLKALS